MIAFVLFFNYEDVYLNVVAVINVSGLSIEDGLIYDVDLFSVVVTL